MIDRLICGLTADIWPRLFLLCFFLPALLLPTVTCIVVNMSVPVTIGRVRIYRCCNILKVFLHEWMYWRFLLILMKSQVLY